jgi:nucleotide-binding universal stress UspA family protein
VPDSFSAEFFPFKDWRTDVHILVGTDGSDGAGRAVELAARLSRDLKASLKIIHVVTLDDPPLDAHNDHANIARRQAEALGAADVHSESLAGTDIAESIIEAARSDNADLIIVGKRGLNRLTGLLLGSVSQKLVSAAPCAVTVV